MKAGLVQGRISADAFLLFGEEIISKKRRNTKSDDLRRRRFRSNFGTTPEICSNVWVRIMFTRRKNIPYPNPSPRHLLWALYQVIPWGPSALAFTALKIQLRLGFRFFWHLANYTMEHLSPTRPNQYLKLNQSLNKTHHCVPYLKLTIYFAGLVFIRGREIYY